MRNLTLLIFALLALYAPAALADNDNCGIYQVSQYPLPVSPNPCIFFQDFVLEVGAGKTVGITLQNPTSAAVVYGVGFFFSGLGDGNSSPNVYFSAFGQPQYVASGVTIPLGPMSSGDFVIKSPASCSAANGTITCQPVDKQVVGFVRICVAAADGATLDNQDQPQIHVFTANPGGGQSAMDVDAVRESSAASTWRTTFSEGLPGTTAATQRTTLRLLNPLSSTGSEVVKVTVSDSDNNLIASATTPLIPAGTVFVVSLADLVGNGLFGNLTTVSQDNLLHGNIVFQVGTLDSAGNFTASSQPLIPELDDGVTSRKTFQVGTFTPIGHRGVLRR